MTATQKIDGLINSWYGYYAFGAAVSLWQGGLGLWSIFTSVVGMLFWFVVTWFIGSRLKNKSSLTRAIIIAGSAIFGVVGAWGTAKLGLAAFENLSLTALIYTGLAGISVFMNVKSLRVLTDSSVKTYFNA